MSETQALLLKSQYTKAVRFWLVLCLILIACMVFVGGYTRLTGSGLSITEWKPIHGSIPPLNEAEWQEEFTKYQQIPQYQQINKGMSMEEFKAIYWPEFWHRNLGRLIGLVFLLPLCFFTLKRAISKPFTLKLIGIFALGGLQGLMGWIMVSSGLENLLFVSHLRLAMHLGLAFILFSLILWMLLCVIEEVKQGALSATPRTDMMLHSYFIFVLLLFAQIIFGAFLAGMHGGLIYNSFPMMNGDWFAPDTFDVQTVWLEHIPLVQFIHRYLAKLLVIYFGIWWFINRRRIEIKLLKPWILALSAAIFLQFLLGVLTLVNAVPLNLALKHQNCALLLFAVSIILGYKLRIEKARNTPKLGL